jgi:uncharacterized protein (TIGR02600 family)
MPYSLKSRFCSPATPSHRGAALVVVLAILVMLLGISVTFLARTSIERTASARFSAAASTRQLADTAVNIVQGQISQATSLGSTVAWASQPGMIRTWGAGPPPNYTASASPYLNFKLYSAPDMVTNSGNFTSDLPSASWATDRATWTDLNAPVNGVFPILDGSAIGNVEGFTVTSAPGSTADQPVPMPTRWLYVLENGNVVAPTGSGGNATVSGATKDNPIVGRIAFWTDDETSKVNINTAGGSEPWDIPRAYTTFDYNKGAQFPPASREVQRFPGHPATTDLRTIFPNLTHKEIADVVPRIKWGGSEGGTKNSGTGGFTSLEYDLNRLYASMEEVHFQPDRSDNSDLASSMSNTDFVNLIKRSRFFLTHYNRSPEINMFNMPRVTVWPISDRIGSTQEDDYTTPFDRTIAFVSRIGEKSGVPNDYFFKRKDAYSKNADWNDLSRNRELLGYLFHLTNNNIPGFGGSFSKKYGQTASNPMPRDRILVAMFDYIRSTNIADPTVAVPYTKPRGPGDPPPGYGQVVPSVIDVTSLPGASSLTDARGFGRFPTMSQFGLWFIGVGDATNPVTGTSAADITALKGANGVIDTPEALKGPDGVAGTADDLNPDDLIQIQAVFIAQFFDPSSGFPVLRPDFTMRIQRLDQLEYEETPGVWKTMGFPADGNLHINAYSPFYHHGNALGGILDLRMMTRYFPDPVGNPNGNVARALAAGPAGFPFFSQVFPIPVSGPMKFRGDTAKPATITLFNGNTTSPAQQVQVFTNLTFPETQTPPPAVPIPTSAQRTAWLTGGGDHDQGYNTFNKRFRKTSGTNWNFLMDGSSGGSSTGIASGTSEILDVVRTYVVNSERADGRVLAINQVSTMNLGFAWRGFNKHPLYDDPTKRMAHSFRTGNGLFFSGGGGGFFVQPSGFNSATTYQSRFLPEVPRDAFAAQPGNFDYIIQPYGGSVGMRPGATPGDWDNGVGTMLDGPFINKPDEGAFITNSGNVPYFQEIQTFKNLPSQHFSPNRQVPSAAMFGSLPSGIFGTQIPYRTLLFRPDPLEGTNRSHFGSLAPKDHLFLDLFHMPVVEPYAISEPFSTAGKINMNYQIQPFTYIKRNTGLRSVLMSERLLIIPNSALTVSGATVTSNYKRTDGGFFNLRFPIQLDRTLEQFEERFTSGDLFRSASEICDIHLVPDDGSTTLSQMRNFASFWETRLLTGDNSKERPYANIYPRLTTKSNTFTVHYRVQALRQSPSSTPGTWNEDRDKVMGEFRGSTTIERFINPNNKDIPDYASSSDPFAENDLSKFYQWRVINTRQFSP